MTQFTFVRTLWDGAIRARTPIPNGPYLLPFSSWYGSSRSGPTALRVPWLPDHLTFGVDSGAYRYTRTGQYPYQVLDYLDWCRALRPAPQWVVMPDWYGLTTQTYRFESLLSTHLPLAGIFANRIGRPDSLSIHQLRTALVSYVLWDHFRDSAACWVPTLQGGTRVDDYIWHARLMRPLVEEMQAYYGVPSAFRVGVGALSGRKPLDVIDIVTAVAAVLPGIPLHLFGIKLRTLQELPASFPHSIPAITTDSAQWNGQRIRGKAPGKKAWHESGLTQLGYAYTVALLKYERRLASAWERLQALDPLPFPRLQEDPTMPNVLRLFSEMRERIVNASHWYRPDLLLSLVREPDWAVRPSGRALSALHFPEKDPRDVYFLYHRVPPRSGVLSHWFEALPEGFTVNPSDYREVALIEADNLGHAFEAANTIDSGHWSQGARVLDVAQDFPLRSTSVGDLLVHCGIVWMVASRGFVPVAWDS